MFTTYTEVKSQDGKRDEARKACENQLADVRRTRGCIAIDLFVDAKDPDRFVFIASWETQELWQQHIDSADQKEVARYFSEGEGSKILQGWSSQQLQKLYA